MPHGKNNIGEFVNSGAAWDSILRCYYKRGAEHPADGIELWVPKFELRTDKRSFNKLLQALGVLRAFAGQAGCRAVLRVQAPAPHY